MQVHYTSNRDDWETPWDIFNEWDMKYAFDLDVCASQLNHKVANYYTPETNGLVLPWQGICWMNAPFSQADVWVKKADEEATNGNAIIIALLAARTDTKRFHRYIYNKWPIRFLPGRITFVGAPNPAPFPSMIVGFGLKELR